MELNIMQLLSDPGKENKEDGALDNKQGVMHSAGLLVPRIAAVCSSAQQIVCRTKSTYTFQGSDNQALCSVPFLRRPFSSVRRARPQRPCLRSAADKMPHSGPAASGSWRSVLPGGHDSPKTLAFRFAAILA